MDHMVKLGKVSNILGVRFQDIGGLQNLDTVLVDNRYLVLEEERVDAFVLVVRANSDQQETEGVHLLRLERTEEMEPSEGEQLTSAFTQRAHVLYDACYS